MNRESIQQTPEERIKQWKPVRRSFLSLFSAALLYSCFPTMPADAVSTAKSSIDTTGKFVASSIRTYENQQRQRELVLKIRKKEKSREWLVAQCSDNVLSTSIVGSICVERGITVVQTATEEQPILMAPVADTLPQSERIPLKRELVSFQTIPPISIDVPKGLSEVHLAPTLKKNLKERVTGVIRGDTKTEFKAVVDSAPLIPLPVLSKKF